MKRVGILFVVLVAFVTVGTPVAGELDVDRSIVQNFGRESNLRHTALWNNFNRLLESDDLETLAFLALKSGVLIDLLRNSPFTLLAPNDDAFMNASLEAFQYNYNNDILRDLLAYHALPGALSSEVIVEAGDQTVGTLNGENISIKVDDSEGIVSISIISEAATPAEVVDEDIHVLNSVIHVIDNVLIPPNFPVSDLVTLAQNAGLSELVNAVMLTDLTETLSSFDPNGLGYTVLAPTNEAFEDLAVELGVTRNGNDTFITDALFDALGSEALSNVLLGHVLNDLVKKRKILNNLSLDCSNWPIISHFCRYLFRFTTLNNEKIKFDKIDGNLVVLFGSNFDRQSQILVTNARALNGVAHVIDTVILPDD